MNSQQSLALVFDTETSGVDPFTDRLVSAYLGLVDLNDATLTPIKEQTWIVLPHPTFEMPEGASRVNGFTNRSLREQANSTMGDAVAHIYDIIEAEQVPVIAYNAGFDLTLLQSEAERFGIEPVTDFPVLDPSVLWKRLEPRRTGQRRLIDAVAAYHLHFEGSEYHSARFDAIAAGRIIQKQLESDLLRGMPWDVLHEAQIGWYREQSLAYQAFRRKTDKRFKATLEWPIYERGEVQ